MQTLEIANLRKRYISPDGAGGDVIDVPLFFLRESEQLAMDDRLYSLYRLKADAVSTLKGVIE